MNLLKWAKKKERRENREILERNKPFHDQIVNEIKARNAYSASRSKMRLIRCVSAFAGVAAAFCCIFFPIYFSGDTGVPTIPVYYSDKSRIKDITLQEWKDGSNNFSFQFNDNFNFEKIELIYDTITNDNLYYHLKCKSNDMLKTFETWTFINPYYRDDKINLNIDDSTEVLINDYTLYYIENYSLNNVIYTYSTNGTIEVGTEMIYISYSETSIAQQSQFIQFVQELVHLKN